jgi:hypothetical protein
MADRTGKTIVREDLPKPDKSCIAATLGTGFPKRILPPWDIKYRIMNIQTKYHRFVN